MTPDPDLERAVAARLRVELDREVGPRPVWSEPPTALGEAGRFGPSRLAWLSVAAVVLVVAFVGSALLVGGRPSPSASPGPSAGGTVAPSSADPLEAILAGTPTSGDGWRLLAATGRTEGGFGAAPSAAGSISIATDGSVLDKIWPAIGLADHPPVVDLATEAVVAIDTVIGVGPVCGQVVIDGVTFDDAAQVVSVQYQDATDVVPVGCRLMGRAGLLVFALDRGRIPSGAVVIRAIRGTGPAPFVSEVTSVLAVPPASPGHGAESLVSVGFVDASFGWALTSGHLLVSGDGGQTWRDVTPHGASMDQASMAGVSFFSTDVGWLILNDGPVGGGSSQAALSVWRTTDGGRSWASSRMPTAGQSFEVLGAVRIAWIDADHVVVDLEGSMGSEWADEIYATSDAGRTWPVHTGVRGATGLPIFTDPRNGFIVGSGNSYVAFTLFRTTDGGRTWRPVSQPIADSFASPAARVIDARFFDAIHGAIVGLRSRGEGQVPVVFVTSDGGASWHGAAPSPPPASACSVVEVGVVTCFAPGNSSGVGWVDGKGSWAAFPVAGLPSGAQPHLMAPDHGWALDLPVDPTALYLTSDGGATWRRVVPGP